MINEQQIKQFQTLYKNRFGEEISEEEALEKGLKLLRLITLVYKPTAKVENQQKTDNSKNKN